MQTVAQTDPPRQVLRPYQKRAVDAMLAALAVHPSALFVAPTGAGKTQIFTAIAEARRHEGQTLVVAHREELIEQAEAGWRRPMLVEARR